MEKPIKIAIVGVGNCASSLIQGIFYYKNVDNNENPVPGLMNNVISGYKISDIKVVAAFDIDQRKVGRDVSEAIFALPNCTKIFQKYIPRLDVEVKMGPVLDGAAGHMEKYEPEKRFVISDQEAVNVVEELKRTGTEILLNYLPVGSEKATQFYALSTLEAGCAFINCIPSFIVSDREWAEKFKEKNLPAIGDDIKAQIGATIIHRTLVRLFSQRGVKINRTYQLNVGGNTDFLNMLAQERLTSKKTSKRESVQSQLPNPLDSDNIHIGPSDYIPWLKDQKICFLRIEGEKFGGIPINIEARLSVEDSPNSAGCVIDAIRLAKLAIDRKIGGPLISASAYLMKHPPQQFTDETAGKMVQEFISDKRER